MNKQKIIGIAVFVTISLLVITTGVVFATGLTQSGPPWLTEDEDYDYGENWGPMHGRRGSWYSDAAFPTMREAMVQVLANATGMSLDAIEARLADGQRLFAIALDAGMDEADYFDLMAETREAFLAEALEKGWITEERYQWMVERMENDPAQREFGGCHRFDEESLPAGSRNPGRGRRGRW